MTVVGDNDGRQKLQVNVVGSLVLQPPGLRIVVSSRTTIKGSQQSESVGIKELFYGNFAALWKTQTGSILFGGNKVITILSDSFHTISMVVVRGYHGYYVDCPSVDGFMLALHTQNMSKIE